MGELKMQLFPGDSDTEFKDGDDGGETGYININIEEVENGYILRQYEEDDITVNVFVDTISLLSHLHELFGVE